MHHTKIVQYLSQLSKSNLQEFRDFVASPYFNKHEKTSALLDYFLQVADWNSPLLERRQVFKKLFSRQTFDEQLLSNLSSYLLRLLRRFLMQQQFEKNDLEQQLNLLEMAFHLGQQNLFELTARQVGRRFERNEVQDSQYHFQQHRYQRLLDDFDLNFGDRSSGEYLEKAVAHFDIFFISEQLKMACQMLARNQVKGRHYTLTLVDELVHWLEKTPDRFQAIPSVWIYFLIYKMMTEERTDHYFHLKERLPEAAPLFREQEGRDLYTHALNYCIQKINFGVAQFRKETFELYQQMLSNQLLYVDKILSQWDYTNIVSLGCHLQEYEWTQQFIFKQKEYLPKAEKENTFTYNLAVFHYYQKDHAQAILLLQEVEFTEVYYNLLTRILRLKIYFEEHNWRALEYDLETFRIYLLRNKQITDQRRKSGLTLLQFARKLMRVLDEQSILSKAQFQQKLKNIQQQIENKNRVLQKSWLLQKIQQYLKRSSPTLPEQPT